jgi:ketosteroid isomerase-like protein
LVPFPTGVLASALSEGLRADQQVAVMLYGIVAALMSAAWIPVFPYLQRHPALLVDPSEAQLFRAQRSRPWIGVISFGLAALVGYLLSPWIAMVLFVWMIAYHAATSEGLHANRIARLFARGPLRQTGGTAMTTEPKGSAVQNPKTPDARVLVERPLGARKERIMDERSNRERVEKAFRDWEDGTGSIHDLLADDVRWTIVGRSQVSKTFDTKEQFIGEVLQPFGARFSQPFRPVAVHGVYADADTVVVLWDGEGTRLDGKPYENTYAWFMRFDEGLVVEATAFFDSIAFNELWNEVTPTE